MNHVRFFSKTVWTDFLVLAILILFVNYYFLGAIPLFTPDEGRYAEIAREMLVTHQFIIPHLDGVIYFEKPPLSYWLNTFMIAVFGYSEWALRSTQAILGMLGCLATYFAAHRLFNRRVGIIASLILSSSLLYVMMSHALGTDMPVTFFLTSCFLSFLLGVQLPKGKARTAWLIIAYICAGLATMTKGLIGIAFPGMTVLIWMLMANQWRLLKEMHVIWGIIIILAINVPWLWLVQAQYPSFLHYYFIDQEFSRYATTRAGREMTIGYYFGILLIGAFPWVLFLPQTIKQLLPKRWKVFREDRNTLYLWIWPTFIFLFFAFSNSILIPYVMPCLPPMAILIARYLDKHWNEPLTASQKVSLTVFALMMLALSAVILILPHKVPLTEAPSLGLLIYWALPPFLAALISFIFGYRWPLKRIFIVMLVGMYLTLMFTWSVSYLFNTKSSKPLALIVKAQLVKHPDAQVVDRGEYYQDSTFYMHHLVTIVTWTNELYYGLVHQPGVNQWMINDATFTQRWAGNQRLYVIMPTDDAQAFCQNREPQCYFLGKTIRLSLITNRDPNS